MKRKTHCEQQQKYKQVWRYFVDYYFLLVIFQKGHKSESFDIFYYVIMVNGNYQEDDTNKFSF